MNADDELLASAYLDGELTVDERRIAESDPAVMAQVEQLRALRAELADVEPPSIDAREHAMAAAMAAFGEIHAGASTSSPSTTRSPVVDISRRRDPMRWLGVAAAVVVIGLLGVVIASGLGGGDDDSASETADDGADTTIEFAADEPATDAGSADDADAPAAADRITESADGAEAEMAAADEATSEATEEPASEPAEEPAEAADTAAAADDMAGAPASLPAALELVDPEEYLDGRPIAIPEELRLVARHLLDLINRRELPPTPNHACPFPDVLSRGVLLDGDTEVEIYIAVTPDASAVLAIDQENCRILLEADLRP